jgi:hypothetical protein
VLRGRPSVLFGVAALVAVLAFQLWISPSNPPGFHHDEAAFALNGYTIAHHLRDQDGALLPVLFPSFDDYKGAFFSYVLAPVIAVFGPSNAAVRGTATAFGILAIALLALLAYRRAGWGVAVVTACLAGLTPWIFQLGRVAYDTSTFPFAAALILVAADVWWRGRTKLLLRSIFLGAALALLTYDYAAGRLLGPLLAVALLVFARRSTLRAITYVWATYAVLLIPFAAYRVRHPSGLTARYDAATFVTDGMSIPHIVGQAVVNYLQDVNPFYWVYAGDPKPYVDVARTPELLGALVAAAVVGAVEILRRRRERYWAYVLIGYFLAPIPASLTVDRHDALRLSAMPVFLAALAIPGLQAIGRLRPVLAYAAGVAFAVAALAQWAHFVDVYSNQGGPGRLALFEADVPSLLARGFSGGRTIYVDHDDAYGRTQAGWYAVTHGIPLSRVVRLPDGGMPPVGSMVFGRTQACDYVCAQLATADSFFLARAVGPKPTS